jgi:hypothetical protein
LLLLRDRPLPLSSFIFFLKLNYCFISFVLYLYLLGDTPHVVAGFLKHVVAGFFKQSFKMKFRIEKH